MFSGSTPLLSGAGAPKGSGPTVGADACGTSANVSGDVPPCAGQSSGKRRERTQHTRPSVGLERSVLHNEWTKGNCH